VARDVDIKISTKADNSGIDSTEKSLKNVGAQSKKTETSLQALGRITYRGLATTLAGVETAMWGIRTAVDTVKGSLLSTLDVAGRMETLQLSLDVMTGGEGQKLFQELDEWAARMPVNTEKAVQSYKMLRAMGIEPTIAQMTTLVDTTSALGGGEQGLESIARALGQIQTKGKVSMEEIMQLAEAGVPVFDILRSKLGLTAQDFENMGKSGVTTGQVIQAVFEGLDERFGGMSDMMMTTWQGVGDIAEDSANRTKRAWADAGFMDTAKAAVLAFANTLDEVRENDSFEVWAKESNEAIIDTFKTAILSGASVLDWINSNGALIENGIVGYMLFGKKGALAFGGLKVLGVDLVKTGKVWMDGLDAEARGFLPKGGAIATWDEKSLQKKVQASGYYDAPKYTGRAKEIDAEIRGLERYAAKMKEIEAMPYNQRLVGSYDVSYKELKNPSQYIAAAQQRISSLRGQLNQELKKVPDSFTSAANKYIQNFDKALASVQDKPTVLPKVGTVGGGNGSGGADDNEAKRIASEIGKIKEDTAQNIHDLSLIGMDDFAAKREDALFAYRQESEAIKGTTRDTQEYQDALKSRYDSEIDYINKLEEASNAEDAKKVADEVAKIRLETAGAVAEIGLIGMDEFDRRRANALLQYQHESEVIKGTTRDTQEYSDALKERYDSEIKKIEALAAAKEKEERRERERRNAYSIQYAIEARQDVGNTSLSSAFIQNEREYVENILFNGMSEEQASYVRDLANETAVLTEQLNDLHGAFTALESPISNFFSNFAQTGKLDFSSLAQGMLQALQIYAAQKTAHLLMESAYEYALGFGKSLNPLTASLAPAHYASGAAYASNAAIMGSFVLGSGLAGMAHDGISEIPSDGTWLLQKKERIVAADTNQDLKQMISNYNATGGTGVRDVIIQTPDFDSFENNEAKTRKIVQNMMDSRKTRRAMAVR